MSAAPSASIHRLKQDYLRLSKDPVPYITTEPLPSNLYEWHYVIRGPKNSAYQGGYYHGKLIFPKEYPFRPPSIYMITPNGRFACNTKLCLSISDFHPDSWTPAWSVSSILMGLVSFMLENTQTSGSISTSTSVKRQFANESGAFNLKSTVFCELFPDIAKEIQEGLDAAQAVTSANTISSQSSSFGRFNGDEARQHRQHWEISSIFVLIVFSLFACLVKCVLQSLS